MLDENGTEMPGGKWSTFDWGVRSGCVMKWPPSYAANFATDVIAQYCDILPTLIEAAAQAAASFGENRHRIIAMADLAMESGLDGLVCSPHEAGSLRKRLGPNALLVTPGIRLPSDDAGDQKRVATPSYAAQQGASYLVLGRTILGAADPRAAAEAVLADLGT